MRFSDLKEKWRDCQECELGRQRNKIVLLRGKVPCDVLFVGEAPGQSENVLGRPFKGPAGRKLDRIIEEGLKEDVDGNVPTHALTNLVACFPKEQKEAGKNEPPKQCIKACAERLNDTVKLCKPKVIVCVGTLADKWVPVITRKSFKGKAYLHILHPAYIIRMDAAQQTLAVRRCLEVLNQI